MGVICDLLHLFEIVLDIINIVRKDLGVLVSHCLSQRSYCVCVFLTET